MMKYFWVTLLYLAFALVNVAVTQAPRVTTPLGEIEGSILTTRLGKPIFSFRNIRYAKPPVGDLRFRAPVPVEKWDDVLNATVDGFNCPQPTTDPISEDCLILNVYTTKLPEGNENPKRPVIIFFHHGGFYLVSSLSYLMGPQYFLDQDIVLVTVNYRLGSLGFLATGDKESPGNYAFKDQVESMKFVKNNIASFGGDPDSITLMGYSAGSFSIYLHMVSPLSRGLFHRAIAMSASAFEQHPIGNDQFALAQKQARLVGCPDDTSANIVKCLRTKSAEELGNSLSGFFEFGQNPTLIWTPVIEGDFGQERFLTDHPIRIVTSGEFYKVPLITGFTKDELSWYAMTLLANASLAEALDRNFEEYAPICFQYERDTENSKYISRELRKFYFGSRHINNSTLPQLANLFREAIITFPVKRSARLLAEYSDQPIYFYKFQYQGRYSFIYSPENSTTPYGVVHHDDLMYLFYIPRLFPEFKPEDPETRMVEKLTTLWANFARTGNPTPERDELLDNLEWEPFTLYDEKYLDNGDELCLTERLFDDTFGEWEMLFPTSQFEAN